MIDDKKKWMKDIVVSYERRLLAYTQKLIPEAKASEVVQDCFLKLWLQEFDQVRLKIPYWLFRVCRNAALDILRREGRVKHLDTGEELIDSNPAIDVRLEALQKENLMLKAIDQLSQKQQEVIRFKFQEGLSYKEISQITGHSVSYVGVIIHEALVTLKEKTKTEGGL